MTSTTLEWQEQLKQVPAGGAQGTRDTEGGLGRGETVSGPTSSPRHWDGSEKATVQEGTEAALFP